MKLVLASQSPRRKEILSKMGYNFTVHPSRSEEVFDESLPLDEALKKVAYSKAKDIYDLYPECAVLGSDTIVTYKGKIYGKPKDLEEARHFLRTFSETTHEVKTAVCVIVDNTVYVDSVTTYVHFRKLSEVDIEHYVQNKNPLDKAGGYGIQESDFVEWIEGSMTNVVGLPAENLEQIFIQMEKDGYTID
jgi:septum formation protein